MAKDNTLVLLAIVGVAIYLFSGGVDTQTPSAAPATDGASVPPPITFPCSIEDVTVTFNGVDSYAHGTSISQAHKALMFDGDVNKEYANAGSGSYSVGADYIVLL